MLKLSVLSALTGSVAGLGCPANVKVLDTFDFQKYAGSWYEVASQNLGLLSSCSCSRYDYKITGENTFDDRFSCTKDGKAGAIDMVLKGKIPDLKIPAKQVESPLYSWTPSAPYWVLEVGKDYEYAVVYACVAIAGEYIYVFHRDPAALTNGLIDLGAIKGRLAAQGIDTSQVKVVSQPASCSYPELQGGAGDEVALATFDGAKGTTHTWKEMNDPVMGGKSNGTTTISGGVLVFDGHVNIVPSLNAPGFITSQVSDGWFSGKSFPDVSGCKGVSLTVKSDVAYSGYRFCFGNSHASGGKRFANGYKALFDAPVGHFGTVQIPFTNFTDFWDDATGDPIKTCDDSPTNCPDGGTLKNMKTMALWGEGVEGKLHIEVKSISAYGCSGTAPFLV